MKKLRLIENAEQLEAWKLEYMQPCDRLDDPEKYPCYVYQEVLNWQEQTVQAQYIYIEQLRNMLTEISDAAEWICYDQE